MTRVQIEAFELLQRLLVSWLELQHSLPSRDGFIGETEDVTVELTQSQVRFQKSGVL